MTTITFILDDDTEVEVDFNYTPECRGSRVNGLQMEPDESESIEIVSIKANGEIVNNDKMILRAMIECSKHVKAEKESAALERALARRDINNL